MIIKTITPHYGRRDIVDTVDRLLKSPKHLQLNTNRNQWRNIEDVPLDIEKVDWDAEYQREIIAELIAHIDEIEQTNQELNERVSSTEEILASKETSLSELNTQLTVLMEQASIVEELESQWNKVKEFETVWPLVAAIVEGKEVNIPKYLEMYVKEQLLAMPQFEDTKKPQVDTSSVKQVIHFHSD